MAVPRKPADPLLVQTIENNLILHQVVDKLDDFAKKQETNHLIALALTEHNTIDRVDELWTDAGKSSAVVAAQAKRISRQVQFLVGGPAIIVAVIAVLTFLHSVLHWF